MFLAILFIVLGVFALLNALGIIVGGSFWGLIWAVILLAIGFKLLRKHGKCPMCGWNHFEARIHQKFHDKMHDHCCDHESSTEQDKVA